MGTIDAVFQVVISTEYGIGLIETKINFLKYTA
jgi:hypothetical protein